jgi:hypothetical protein
VLGLKKMKNGRGREKSERKRSEEKRRETKRNEEKRREKQSIKMNRKGICRTNQKDGNQLNPDMSWQT